MTGSADPAETSIEVFAEFAPALGQAFGEARDRGELLFGFAEHSMSTTYLGTSTGLRLRTDQPTGRVELNGKSPDFARSVWSGTSTRDFARRVGGRARRRGGAEDGAGRSAASTSRPGATRRCCRRRRSAT